MIKQRIQRFFICFFILLFLLFLLLPCSQAAEDEPSLIWVHLSAGSGSSLQIRLHGSYSMNDRTLHNGVLTLQTASDGIRANHSTEGFLGTYPQISLSQQTPTTWNSYLSLKNNLYGTCNYPGNMTISKKDLKSFDLVNSISLDQYVCSILDNILPDNAFPESVKALAVALRSLVLSNLSGNGNFDFEDNEACQEYRGYSLNCENILNVLQSVQNEVLIYKDKILPCYYCMSNGGYGICPSDRWENIPTSENSPYLGSYDPYDLASSPDTVYFVLPSSLTFVSQQTLDFLQQYLEPEKTLLRTSKILSLETFNKPSPDLNFESETTLPVWLRATILCKTEQNEKTLPLEFPLEILARKGIVKAPAANTCFLLHAGQSSWIFVFSNALGSRVGMSLLGMQHLASLGFSYTEILSVYYPNTTIRTLPVH